jgi:hypothetical protein
MSTYTNYVDINCPICRKNELKVTPPLFFEGTYSDLCRHNCVYVDIMHLCRHNYANVNIKVTCNIYAEREAMLT